MSVSFGLASTQGAWSSITLSTGVPAGTKRPSWILSTCVAVPDIGARTIGVVEIALGVVERGLGLGVFGELGERQVGIAEQLIERGVALLRGELRLQLRGHQRGGGGIDVGLRAGLRGSPACVLRSTSRLLQLDVLLRRDRRACSSDFRLVFSLS